MIYGIILATLVWYFTNRGSRLVVPPDPNLQRVVPCSGSCPPAPGIDRRTREADGRADAERERQREAERARKKPRKWPRLAASEHDLVD